ncbi:MAG: hypothetical protein D6797_09410 [Bdellovibrio sp.]|nr:MAG: hypothetical protein D6797_09410 [Bdellovibrio sp.]
MKKIPYNNFLKRGKTLKRLIFLCGFLVISPVWAADLSVSSTSFSTAKYPGMQDEEQLRVQEELYIPHRKLKEKDLQEEVIKALKEKEAKEEKEVLTH